MRAGNAKKRRWFSVTGLRLGAAFVALLGLFAAALVATTATLDRLAHADAELDNLDHARHAGHKVAALLREQYLQQLHAVVDTDYHSVAPHYERAVRATRAATAELVDFARTHEEAAHAAEIARLARRADEAFRLQMLPALERGRRDDVLALHERIEGLVGTAVRLNERLNVMFDTRASAARVHAGALRRDARAAMIVFFVTAIAVAAAVGLLITRSILKRVSALRAGALRVGAGDLGARIHVPGRDEFAELAAAFNQMTADLGRHQDELVRSKQLASIGHVAAGVAHEINNPLGVILGYVKLLRRREPDAEEPRIIQDEALQCQRIVQGLLDLARPPRLQLAPVDLADLARDAAQRLEETGKLEGLTLRGPPPGTVALARGDEARLRQVLWNVLVNAAEATPPGGHIEIEAAGAPGEVVLTVSDTGPGLPPEVITRAFEPFFTTKAQGTGLGLPIAQSIVEAHGGRIELGAGPGGGARVALCIPAAEPAVASGDPT